MAQTETRVRTDTLAAALDLTNEQRDKLTHLTKGTIPTATAAGAAPAAATDTAVVEAWAKNNWG